MATNKTVTVIVLPTLTGDTVASYNVYEGVSGTTLLGTMSVAEAAAGKIFAFTDGIVHSVKTQTVWTTAGASTIRSAGVELDLSTSSGWGLSGASYDSISDDFSATDTTLTGVFFKPDGTKMYYMGGTNFTTYEWTLSTPWDITTKTSPQTKVGISGQIGLFFKPDGTKVYHIAISSKKILESTLSTPWDISSAGTYANGVIVLPNAAMIGLFMKSDGTSCFIANKTTSSIDEFYMSTPWLLSSMSSVADNTFNITAQDTGTQGVYFKSDGTKMFVIGETLSTIFEYDLGTPWDISTAVYSTDSLVVSTESNNMRGMFIKPDGLKMWLASDETDTNYQYSLT